MRASWRRGHLSWSIDVYEWEFARHRMGLWGETIVYEKVIITDSFH